MTTDTAPLSADDDDDLDRIGKLMDVIVAEADARRAELEDWKARATQAGDERDALLTATGFKTGPLGDGLRRKVILDDVGGLRDAMVKARQEAKKSQSDAILWRMSVEDHQPLLVKVWEQRRSAVRELADTKAALSASQAREAGMREALSSISLAERETSTPAADKVRDMARIARAAPASPTPTAQTAQADVECYWDAADRESGYPEISDIMESYGHGAVAEIEHVAIVKRTFHATLPAHGDDDDGWEVEALTEAEAQAALNAELARRSSAPSTSAGEA